MLKTIFKEHQSKKFTACGLATQQLPSGARLKANRSVYIMESETALYINH